MRGQRLIQRQNLAFDEFLLFFSQPGGLACFLRTMILVTAGRCISHHHSSLLARQRHLIDILVPAASNIVAHAAPLLHKSRQFDPIEHALLFSFVVTYVLMRRFSEAMSIVHVVALFAGDCTDLLELFALVEDVLHQRGQHITR